MVLGIAWADPVQFGAVQCDLSVSVFGGLLSHGGRMPGEDRQETHGSLSLDASIAPHQSRYFTPVTPRALLVAPTDVIGFLAFLANPANIGRPSLPGSH
jgi:hypothetical protein